MSKALATVSDDRKARFGTGEGLDIAFPFLVLFNTVHGNAHHLGAALFPFVGKLCDCPEFGGADRREILWVRKKDRPAVAHPVVQADRALIGFDSQIGDGIVDAQGHNILRLHGFGLSFTAYVGRCAAGFTPSLAGPQMW
jgi:hypothetical protein